jgi:hypothetical protein
MRNMFLTLVLVFVIPIDSSYTKKSAFFELIYNPQSNNYKTYKSIDGNIITTLKSEEYSTITTTTTAKFLIISTNGPKKEKKLKEMRKKSVEWPLFKCLNCGQKSKNRTNIEMVSENKSTNNSNVTTVLTREFPLGLVIKCLNCKKKPKNKF